jgi:hypothetical protein
MPDVKGMTTMFVDRAKTVVAELPGIVEGTGPSRYQSVGAVVER